jgi:hypothetical protein
MSVAQLRRRTDALQKRTGATYLQSMTLEEACRRLWRMNKRTCEKMAREGDRAIGFYMGVFEAEELEAVERRRRLKST